MIVSADSSIAVCGQSIFSLPSLPLQILQTLEIQGSNEMGVMEMEVMRLLEK